MLINSFNNGEINPFLKIKLLVLILFVDNEKAGIKNSSSKLFKFFKVKLINKLNEIIKVKRKVVKIELGNQAKKIKIKNNEGKYFRNPNVLKNELIKSFHL
ncbi:MAG: hypothetical protein STSR0008_02400 [Ignavibacterium sp.]